MKPFIVVFLLLLIGQIAFGQVGNEWINFNQQYYKLAVASDGLYRLTYEDLQAAGFPVGSDARRIQVFHRGVEQAIRVQKANSGVLALQPGDFIEFVGYKNNGMPDAVLYEPASAQPHQYYNLFNDTTAYFLTFNPLAVLGKRMEETTDINVGGVPKETYHTDEKLLVLKTQYSTGKRFGDYLQNSYFEQGEGWTGDEIMLGNSVDYTLTGILNGATTSGVPQLEIMCVGRVPVQHRVEISVGPTTPSRVVATRDFSNYATTIITVPLAWTDIGADGRLFVRVKALGVGSSDRLSASYIRVTYPQNFNAASVGSKIFRLNANGGNESYIEIQNAPAGARLYDMTDPAAVKVLRTTSSTTLNSLVPETAEPRTLLLSNTFITPTIRKVSFRQVQPADHDYIIISHPLLMKAGGGYANPVKSYGAYRASASGGSYDTLIMPIQQLYDQFNYGEISPYAIRRFMKFMVDNGDPKYLFIIGKGLDVWYDYYRNPSDFTTYKSLVPSYGMPASDTYFTVGLGADPLVPAVPTGRISASTPTEVAAYLNKVKEIEALPHNMLWRKNLLHLSGGISSGEPARFRGYVDDFGNIAKDVYLGGKISTISKNSTDIEFINISDKINEGVSLVTLFGHSSSSQNDFNIGFVSAAELGYNNPGKYPMFLINGCNAGDFFATTQRYGEDWIHASGKGAVGFIANTSFGFEHVLRIYSSTFYSVAFGDSSYIYRGVGDVQQEVARRFSTSGFTAPEYKTQIHQMFLLADPAVSVFGAPKPDYEINDGQVFEESVDGQPITALSETFALKLVVRNFGRVFEDSIRVVVKRTFSDNTFVEYDSLFKNVFYQDTLSVIIPQDRQHGAGNNTFTVTLDSPDAIDELDESNNTAQLELFIPLNAARNLYPQGFGIVSTTSPNLVVQSTDLLSESRDYVIQLDTVDTFNSNFLQEFVVTGTLVSQTVALLENDTTAYYWRSRFAVPQEGEEADWTTSTFTYIENGPEGWAQVHFPQYLSNTPAGLLLDADARLIRLQETVTDVSIKTFGADNATPVTSVSVKVNNTEFNPESTGTSCRDNTLNLIAFDKTTTFPYVSIPVQFPDPRACGRRPEIMASFLTSELESGDGKDLIQYITNVPAGDSVVLFSIGDAGYAAWSTNVRNKLGELGISIAQINALATGEPVVIFARKGSAPGTARFVRTATPPVSQQVLTTAGTITGRYTSGTLSSGIIGPASSWQQLVLNVKISELPQTDVYQVDVMGIAATGEEEVVYEDISTDTDISLIDASVYPYIRLVYTAEDETNLTAPQLSNWLVVFTPVAEGVLKFNSSLSQQQLMEGESWTGNYSFTNISGKTFADSLTVRYQLANRAARGIQTKTKKIKAPAPGATTDFQVTIPTVSMAGLNDLDVFVNPRILPELYYDNNVLQLDNYLLVNPDEFGPVLAVTIDGRQVIDGDFVSDSPEIRMLVWDENAFLPRTDTAGLRIYLQYPCDGDCFFKPVYFNREDVTWSAATATTPFEAMFNPQNLADGEYILRVEAFDVVGNPGGDEPYEVRFVVSSSVINTLERPYPNPSSGNVTFRTTLTGDNHADMAMLQVVNSLGHVVWEGRFESLITGTNALTWPGTDQADNPLPGGLYIYRMRLLRDQAVIRELSGKLMLSR
jgi:hypothetical protein